MLLRSVEPTTGFSAAPPFDRNIIQTQPARIPMSPKAFDTGQSPGSQQEAGKSARVKYPMTNMNLTHG